MGSPEGEKPPALLPKPPGKRGGRELQHGLGELRRDVRAPATRRLDGRSAVAIAVKRWKANIERDLGGDLSESQRTVLELAAQSMVVISSLDSWIARRARHGSLVTKKRTVLPVVLQRQQIAEG